MRLVDKIPWDECRLKDIEEILARAKVEKKNIMQMVNLLYKEQKTDIDLRREINKQYRKAKREQKARLRRL